MRILASRATRNDIFRKPLQCRHAGRADESGRSTIETLPEIMKVSGTMPVLIDSGFRRGTDIVKALCTGAKGVAVGRPYLWGLGTFASPASNASCKSCAPN